MVAAAQTSERSPYLHLVPKDRATNLRFRREMNHLGHESDEAALNLWIMCSRDLLFWLNTFAFIFEPRPGRPLPFITYPYQDTAFLEIDAAIGKTDFGIEKSRDMAGTWGILAVFVHQFLFRPDRSFLVVSRNQDLVDKTGNPDCLFWKVDFLLDNLPTWMWTKGQKARSLLHVRNLENGSIIDGVSTTGDIARGGRRACIMLDEFAAFLHEAGYATFAATQAATDSRGFLSTPKGAVGAYYDVMHGDQSEFAKIRLHWSQHPLKNPGLYTSDDNVLRILDKDYEFPPDYKFICDGKLRSPWYDKQCRRPGATPAMIAQELDIEYHGSANPFYNMSVIDRLIRDTARPRLSRGTLAFDRDSLEPAGYTADAGGLLSLWINLDAKGRPAGDRWYVAGADIAQGTGASNSVLVVYDRVSREKVAQLVTPHMTPEAFGRLAVAVCRFFAGREAGQDGDLSGAGGAFLIWEANGPGRGFERAVRDSGYRNVFYRDQSSREQRFNRKASRFPGFYTTPETRGMLHGGYREALDGGTIINRDEKALNECREFVFGPAGDVLHQAAMLKDDPSNARESHGDIVVADALVAKILTESPMTAKSVERVVHEDDRTFAGRRMRRRKREAEMDDWDRALAEMN